MAYNPFHTIDDAIMDVVNKTVRAYNWTTGGTKAELALNLVGAATTAEIAAFLMSNNYAVMGGIFIATPNCVYLKLYPLMEQKELDCHAKDYQSEIFNKLFGYLGLSGFGTMTSGHSGFSTVGLGFALLGISHFVMRADPVLPQKNVFRRTMESLEEKMAQPMPSEGWASYSTLTSFMKSAL